VLKPSQAGTFAAVAAAFSDTMDPRLGNNVSVEQTRVRSLEAPIPFTGKIEFTGVVQSRPNGGIGAWTIQGLTVQVTADTKIKGDPATGDTVKVEGSLDSDGTVAAKEIKSHGDDDKPKKDKESRPGKGLGDRNHKHTGPPGHDDNDDDQVVRRPDNAPQRPFKSRRALRLSFPVRILTPSRATLCGQCNQARVHHKGCHMPVINYLGWLMRDAVPWRIGQRPFGLRPICKVLGG
jgi:hypothetical protein